MQQLLFYSVEMGVGENYAKYILPSNLPFPSPEGTQVFLSCDDEHLLRGFRGAEVRGYEHWDRYDRETQRSSLHAFYMNLIPPQDKQNKEPAWIYYIKPECYSEFREQMLEFGWKIVTESQELRPKET